MILKLSMHGLAFYQETNNRAGLGQTPGSVALYVFWDCRTCASLGGATPTQNRTNYAIAQAG